MVEWLAWLCRVDEGLGESSSSVSSLSNGTSSAPGPGSNQSINPLISCETETSSLHIENIKIRQNCTKPCGLGTGAEGLKGASSTDLWAALSAPAMSERLICAAAAGCEQELQRPGERWVLIHAL